MVFGGVANGTLAVLVSNKLGAVAKKPPHHFHVASTGGEVKWGGTIPISQVGVHPLLLDLYRSTYLGHLQNNQLIDCSKKIIEIKAMRKSNSII